MPDFVPRSDVKCLEWSRNFAANLSAAPQRFGLTEADAAAFAEVQRAFAEAMRLATDPSTRTRPSIIAKDDARAAMLRVGRLLARRARALLETGPQADPAAKLILGLGSGQGRSARRTRIGPPTGRPWVRIRKVDATRVSVRLRDPDAPTRRGKGYGIFGAAIYTFVGQQPPAEMTMWRYDGTTSCTNVVLDFGATVLPGSLVWICARWENTTGQLGPASWPCCVHVNHPEPQLQGTGKKRGRRGTGYLMIDSRYAIPSRTDAADAVAA